MLIELSKRTNKYTIKFIGCYWTAIDEIVRFRHKADVQKQVLTLCFFMVSRYTDVNLIIFPYVLI